MCRAESKVAALLQSQVFDLPRQTLSFNECRRTSQNLRRFGNYLDRSSLRLRFPIFARCPSSALHGSQPCPSTSTQPFLTTELQLQATTRLSCSRLLADPQLCNLNGYWRLRAPIKAVSAAVASAAARSFVVVPSSPGPASAARPAEEVAAKD